MIPQTTQLLKGNAIRIAKGTIPGKLQEFQYVGKISQEVEVGA